MSGEQDRPEGATNARPKDETIAETGPGLADDAIGPGEAGLLDDVENEALEQRLKADRAEFEKKERR